MSQSDRITAKRRLTNLRMDLDTLNEPNCNISENTPPFTKTTSSTNRDNSGNNDSGNRDNSFNKICRKWTKYRHKHNGPPNIDPENRIVPLFVTNIMDKL